MIDLLPIEIAPPGQGDFPGGVRMEAGGAFRGDDLPGLLMRPATVVPSPDYSDLVPVSDTHDKVFAADITGDLEVTMVLGGKVRLAGQPMALTDFPTSNGKATLSGTDAEQWGYFEIDLTASTVTFKIATSDPDTGVDPDRYEIWPLWKATVDTATHKITDLLPLWDGEIHVDRSSG